MLNSSVYAKWRDSGLFPYFIYVLCFFVPLFGLHSEFWDGAIIDYAHSIGQYEGLKAWFFDSGWVFQYFQVRILFFISDLTSMSYTTINHLALFCFGLLLLHETYLFAINIFKLDKRNASFVILLLAIFPVWSVLTSSVLTFHFICLSLAFWSIRIIRSHSKLWKVPAWILVLIVFNFNSLLVFLPCLSYIYDLRSERTKRNYLPGLITIILFGIAIIEMLIYKVYFPPTGIYEGYNAVKTGFKLHDIYMMLINAFRFHSYLLIPFLFFIFSFKKAAFNESKKDLLLILILFWAGIFPYVMVGKSSTLFSYANWDHRQAFLIAPVVALLIGKIIQSRMNDPTRIFLLLKPAAALFFLTLLLFGFALRYNRLIFEKDLANALKPIESEIKAGRLELICTEVPLPEYRIYEANYFMYRHFSRSDTWTSIDTQLKEDFTVPELIRSNPTYQKNYIYTSSDSADHKQIHLTCTGYQGLADVLKNVLGLEHEKGIRIVSNN